MSRQHPAGTHPDPQIARLPKWAQQHIALLERRIEETRAKLAIAEGGALPDDADCWAGGALDDADRRPLVDGVATFRVDGGSLDVKRRHGRVEVYARGGRVAVMPEVTNVVTLLVVEKD